MLPLTLFVTQINISEASCQPTTQLRKSTNSAETHRFTACLLRKVPRISVLPVELADSRKVGLSVQPEPRAGSDSSFRIA